LTRRVRRGPADGSSLCRHSAGQSVVVVGVCAGQNLALLPAGTEVPGIGLSVAMLALTRAQVPAPRCAR